MTKLSAYLTRLFATDAAALFAVALFLLYLVQLLRSFDLVSVRGQDLLVLLGQAVLTMPTVAIVLLPVCLAIGLARGLRALQASHELHIIHASRLTRALLAAIGTYIGGGLLLVLLLTHLVEPATSRQFNDWNASIAADLVSRTLTPQKFVQVVPGVTLHIGERGAGGELVDFFADDDRGETRRTYIARSALVTSDPVGYVLRLEDGAIQYHGADNQFSEISFARYDLALERLTGDSGHRNVIGESNSVTLVAAMLESGEWSGARAHELGERFSEAVRLVALTLFVTAIASLPHGRRSGREVPLEILVLVAAFLERGVTLNWHPAWLGMPASGAILLLAGALVVLAFRYRQRRPIASGPAP